MTKGVKTHTLLRQAGYGPYLKDVVIHGHSVSFELTRVGRDKLAKDLRFARGALHGLHSDVGDALTDYRSYHGELCPQSLQIVVDTRTGRAYADLDGANPYEDLVKFVGHARDVMGNWLKRLFRKGR